MQAPLRRAFQGRPPPSNPPRLGADLSSERSGIQRGRSTPRTLAPPFFSFTCAIATSKPSAFPNFRPSRKAGRPGTSVSGRSAGGGPPGGGTTVARRRLSARAGVCSGVRQAGAGLAGAGERRQLQQGRANAGAAPPRDAVQGRVTMAWDRGPGTHVARPPRAHTARDEGCEQKGAGCNPTPLFFLCRLPSLQGAAPRPRARPDPPL